MKNKVLAIKEIILLFSLVVLFLSITSCDEDPIAPQEEHVKAVGMVFYSSGIEIARISTGITDDTLTAPLGGLSDHLDVKFIGADGEIFDPPSSETQILSWEFENPSMLNIWQHEGEEGSFAFHLQGLKIGVTNIEFFVMHNDHSDFRSGKIPVKIVNETGSYGIPIGLEITDETAGNILVAINNSQVVGQIYLKTAETTDHLAVEFFDINGNHFTPSSPPHSLYLGIEDQSVASIIEPSESEPWAFNVTGIKPGTTTLTIKLLHDGNVGVTFEPVTINVN